MRIGSKGYADEVGWLFFVDRTADMIKRAGENISATEFVNMLASYPRIASAAVIGVPDPI